MGKYEIFFKNQNKIVYAQKGELLSDICERAGYPLDLVCGGKGTCGKCKIVIEIDNKKSEVLACMKEIQEELSVYLTKDDIKKDSQILSNGLKLDQYNGSIYKKIVNVERKNLKHCGNLIDTVKINDNTK